MMTHGMAEIEILEAEIERAEAKAHEFESEAIHNGEIMQSLAAEVAALKARIAEMEATEKELEHQNELREKLAKLARIQSQEGNWNYSEYMRGLANGLLLATATMNDEATYEPFMYPDIWIEDMERTPPTEAPAP